MITRTANKWADWLVANGAEPESHEIIVYGIECAFNEVIANLIVFAIAFIIHMSCTSSIHFNKTHALQTFQFVAGYYPDEEIRRRNM